MRGEPTTAAQEISVPCEIVLPGDPGADEKLAREALDEAILRGDDNLGIGRRLATLGETLVASRQLREALEVLARAYKMLAPHPETRAQAAEIVDLLGVAYESLGDHRRAEQAFLEGLHLREELFGSRAVQIVSSMDHLFHLYRARHEGTRDQVQAEDALKRALAVLTEAGPEHLPHIVTELAALGELYEHEARWGDAVRCTERAVQLRAQLEGIESPRLAPLLRQLGRAYRHARNLEAAEYCARRALFLVDANHGGTPQRAFPYVLELIDLLRDAGKAEEALFYTAIATKLWTQSHVPPAS